MGWMRIRLQRSLGTESATVTRKSATPSTNTSDSSAPPPCSVTCCSPYRAVVLPPALCAVGLGHFCSILGHFWDIPPLTRQFFLQEFLRHFRIGLPLRRLHYLADEERHQLRLAALVAGDL